MRIRDEDPEETAGRWAGIYQTQQQERVPPIILDEKDHPAHVETIVKFPTTSEPPQKTPETPKKLRGPSRMERSLKLMSRLDMAENQVKANIQGV